MMTKAEFYEKHGAVEVTFSSYYKFTFTYAAILPDGSRLTCRYGGNAEEIYRHEVVAGNTETVLSLQPFEGAVYKDGEQVESFYDY